MKKSRVMVLLLTFLSRGPGLYAEEGLYWGAVDQSGLYSLGAERWSEGVVPEKIIVDNIDPAADADASLPLDPGDPILFNSYPIEGEVNSNGPIVGVNQGYTRTITRTGGPVTHRGVDTDPSSGPGYVNTCGYTGPFDFIITSLQITDPDGVATVYFNNSANMTIVSPKMGVSELVIPGSPAPTDVFIDILFPGGLVGTVTGLSGVADLEVTAKDTLGNITEFPYPVMTLDLAATPDLATCEAAWAP